MNSDELSDPGPRRLLEKSFEELRVAKRRIEPGPAAAAAAAAGAASYLALCMKARVERQVLASHRHGTVSDLLHDACWQERARENRMCTPPSPSQV